MEKDTTKNLLYHRKIYKFPNDITRAFALIKELRESNKITDKEMGTLRRGIFYANLEGYKEGYEECKKEGGGK